MSVSAAPSGANPSDAAHSDAAPSVAGSAIDEESTLELHDGAYLFDRLIGGTENVDIDDPEADEDCMDCGRKVKAKECQKLPGKTKKKVYIKCNACNALRARMQRLSKHK